MSRPGPAITNSFLAIAAMLGMTGCNHGPVASKSTSSMETQDQGKAFRPASRRLVCPPFGTLPASAAQELRGHAVVLSWKASAAADSKHPAAVGYCVYRGTKPGAPSELVNATPFAGTSCSDDLVENGKKYYYVVRSISAQGVTSITTKPAPAAIPRTPRNQETSESSAPLCRQTGSQTPVVF